MFTLPTHPRTGMKAIGRRRNGDLIWPILGGAPDPDPDDDNQGDNSGDGDDKQDDDTDQGDQSKADTDDDTDLDGSDALGDAGKKALDAMKAKAKDERSKRRAAEAELEKLRNAAKDGDGAKPDTDAIRREAETAATQKANARIVRSEIRAAAAGKLADPKDALTFLDLDQFEVDDNGEVDSDEVADAIDDLIKNKPYLAAQGGKRFQGTADGGAARKAGTPKQLTREQLDGMSAQEIVKAKADGRLNKVLGVK